METARSIEKKTKMNNSSAESSPRHPWKGRHEFLHVPRKGRRKGDDSVDSCDNNEDCYELANGENWLRLLTKNRRSVLDDTQDEHDMMVPYPSILSLASVGSINAPSKDCYLCIDVDDEVLTIKDMRILLETNNNNDTEDCETEIGISRQKGALWEPLPRRQLRVLHPGDHLCTSLTHTTGKFKPGGLILEYQYSQDNEDESSHQSSNKSMSMKNESERSAVSRTPGTPSGSHALLTQEPCEADDEDMMTETETQTEKEPPLRDIPVEQVDKKPPLADDAEDDSDKTVEMQETSSRLPSPTNEVVLATQPNEGEDSDDETTLGDNEDKEANRTTSRNDIPFTQLSIGVNGSTQASQISPKESEGDKQKSLKDDQRRESLESQSTTALHNSQMSAGLCGETQDPTQSLTQGSTIVIRQQSQQSLTLCEETQDASTQASIRKSDVSETLCEETEDAQTIFSKSCVTETLNEEAQDAETQATIHESDGCEVLCEEASPAPTAKTGDIVNDVTSASDDGKDKMETGSHSSDDVSVTLLGETGPERPLIEPMSQDLDIAEAVQDTNNEESSLETRTGPSADTNENNNEPNVTGQEDIKAPVVETTRDAGSEDDQTSKNAPKEQFNVVEEGNNNSVKDEAVAENDDDSATQVSEVLLSRDSCKPVDIGSPTMPISLADGTPTKLEPDHDARAKPSEESDLLSNHVVTAENLIREHVDQDSGDIKTSTGEHGGQEADAEGANSSGERRVAAQEVQSPQTEMDMDPSPTSAELGQGDPKHNPSADDLDKAKESKTVTISGKKAKDSLIQQDTDEVKNTVLSTPIPTIKHESSTVDPSRTRRTRKTPQPAEEFVTSDTKPPSSKRARMTKESGGAGSKSSSKRKVGISEPTSVPPSSKKKTRSSPSAKSIAIAEEPEIRVMTTGIEVTSAQKNMVKRIGGILLENIEDSFSATHIIAGDDETSLRRTPKLMIGLCRTSNIVRLDWLLQSAKEKKPLPCKAFLLLDDKQAESLYSFSMRESMTRSDQLRSSGKTLLAGFFVHVCSGVAGNKAKNNRTPPIKEFKLIIEAAGAAWMSSIPEPGKKDTDFSKVILVSSKIGKEAKKQLSVKRVAEAIELGAKTRSTEELFHGIMTQQFCL